MLFFEDGLPILLRMGSIAADNDLGRWEDDGGPVNPDEDEEDWDDLEDDDDDDDPLEADYYEEDEDWDEE